MGNSNSSNQQGGNIVEIQSKVEAFIQKLMNEKGDKINNNQFCDHIQLVLKDNILSSFKKSDLLDMNSNYDIGFKLNDTNSIQHKFACFMNNSEENIEKYTKFAMKAHKSLNF